MLAEAWMGKEWYRQTISKHLTTYHSMSLIEKSDRLVTRQHYFELLENSSGHRSRRKNLSLAASEDLTKAKPSNLRDLSSAKVRMSVKSLGLSLTTRMNLLGPGHRMVLLDVVQHCYLQLIVVALLLRPVRNGLVRAVALQAIQS